MESSEKSKTQTATPDLRPLEMWYKSELFPPEALKLYEIIDKYAAESARQIAVDVGLLDELTEPRQVDDAIGNLNVIDGARPLLRRVAQILCAYGMGSTTAEGTVQLDPLDQLFNLETLRKEGLEKDEKMAPAFRMADRVRERALAFVKGEAGDNELRANVHSEFFIECPIGRQGSELGGAVIRAIVEAHSGPGFEIMELGAGTMSGTFGVLDKLTERNLISRIGCYYFTELNPFFVVKARDVLPPRYTETDFRFVFLNFNNSLTESGFKPNSIDLVHAVNALHCAKDLPFTLASIIEVLKPGGWLVIPQYTRNSDAEPLPFIDLICDPLRSYWDVQLVPGLRPTHGLMAVENWRMVIEHAGFVDFTSFPDQATGIAYFSDFYFVGAIIARKPL